MLTIHAADLLVPGAGHEQVPVPGGAVAVDGDRIAALGPYEEVAAAYPHARVRRWPGVLTPGLVRGDAAGFLEAAYHPDPREADVLGTEPVTGEALTALGMTDARWGESARRGVQRLLRSGVTAVVGPFTRPEVRTAVARSGLALLPGAPAEGAAPGAGFAGTLAVGARADFAVFAVPAEDAVPVSLTEAGAEAGARSCVATVLGGRLLHRRR
ncbi:hypothetical protein [Streptomyces sp. XD-27]|uniref:imidazolonepropionase-like domain-containing protein n=1 Tax=Streptomyces sp. XD-27 TaxID=3062779 RepID=UPI0026F459A4|nr:hypothetical protein [Streptomyces sp. XD-27]WKX71927.1 hypothetical protein Q3Y56_20300 [Streptomyces sp. XD-27]